MAVHSISDIQKIVSELALQYGAERVYLFGSYARGDMTAGSDIDLRIDKGSIRGLAFAGLLGDLEDALGTHVDLISTAGSCIEVVEALREAGAEVLGVASIFTYGLQKGLDRLAAANVVNHSLSNFDAVCEAAAEEGKIKPEDIERLKRFRANPSDESWITSK